jgi:predicted RNA methylase
LGDLVTVIQADASEFVPDSPVDVVICEMLHVGLLREKQSQVISAFKRNYTRAHGPRLPIFIPEASILMSQLVEQSFEFAGYVAPVPMFQAPMVDQPRTRELSALLPYASLAYHETLPNRFDASQRVETQAAGTVNAVRFVTQNVLTINMQQQRAIVWPNQCLVLPLDTPIDVEANQACQLTFGYPSGGSIDELSASLQVT